MNGVLIFFCVHDSQANSFFLILVNNKKLLLSLVAHFDKLSAGIESLGFLIHYYRQAAARYQQANDKSSVKN